MAAPDYLLRALQVQQLKETRVVCGYSSYYWSTEKLLQTFGWLSVKQQEFYWTTLLARNIVTSSLRHNLWVDMVQPHTVRTAAEGQITYVEL